MDTPTPASTDLGICSRCGGRIAATHMLTKTYEVDAAGRWRRILDDFAEDVVVVCAACGVEPEGSFDAGDGEFIFVPATS
jgi:hypothetical protein